MNKNNYSYSPKKQDPNKVKKCCCESKYDPKPFNDNKSIKYSNYNKSN